MRLARHSQKKVVSPRLWSSARDGRRAREPELALLSLGELQIEYRFEPALPGAEDLPPLVFLHEGLGSTALWRDFPGSIRASTGGAAMLVYSRPGHGRSTTLKGPRSARYMHDEALDVLPAVLEAFGMAAPVLIGHSDGGSIAIIHAGAGFPVSALVLLAPHVFVEDRSIQGIEAARAAYLGTDLPERVRRHHNDGDSTFWGWNDIWLSAEFRGWNIEEYLPGISCPVLLVQGDADEYGTLAQLEAIECGVRGRVERVVIPDACHAPHLDHRSEVIDAAARFLRERA